MEPLLMQIYFFKWVMFHKAGLKINYLIQLIVCKLFLSEELQLVLILFHILHQLNVSAAFIKLAKTLTVCTVANWISKWRLVMRRTQAATCSTARETRLKSHWKVFNPFLLNTESFSFRLRLLEGLNCSFVFAYEAAGAPLIHGSRLNQTQVAWINTFYKSF